MSKKFHSLALILCITTSHAHAVHMLDALNYFLHSTAPKLDRDYPYEQAQTHEQLEEIYKIRCKKIMTHAVASAFLCACVFNVVLIKQRS